MPATNGNDTLLGTDGDDILDGLDGNDILVGDPPPSPVTPTVIVSFDGSGFDATRVEDPTVVYVGGEYRMFYSGLPFSNGYQIGMATSLDGVTWTQSASPVLSHTDSQPWASFRTHPVTALHEDGVYKLWFNGDNTNLDTDSGRVRGFGYATSTDGVTWTLSSANPIRVEANIPFGNAMSLTEVVRLGDELVAYYVDHSPSGNVLYRATSTDGVTFTGDTVMSTLPGFELVAATGAVIDGVEQVVSVWRRDGLSFLAFSTDGVSFATTRTLNVPLDFYVRDLRIEGDDLRMFGDMSVGNINWGFGNSVVGVLSESLLGYGDDVLSGGNGDDVITGGGGDDTIDGGAGTDTAVFSHAIADGAVSTVNGVTTVTGLDGIDTLTNIERLRFADGVLIVGAGGGQYFEGTAGHDAITGTVFNDLIHGGEGRDNLVGHNGDDVIHGGDGADNLYPGNSGVDALFGEGGDDGLFATVLTNGTTYDGGSGTDTFVSELATVPGEMYLALGGASGRFTVGGLVTVDNVERIIGNGGHELFDFRAATTPVDIQGMDGNHLMLGGAGDDWLREGIGDDLIVGGGGNDIIDGYAGNNDVVVYGGLRSAYTITHLQGWVTVVGPDGVDNIIGVERMLFADGLWSWNGDAPSGPNITGTSGADGLTGGEGGQYIVAGAGDDLITGATEGDVIDGGDGMDTAIFAGTLAESLIRTIGGVTIVASADGLDSLINVERLQFSDGTLIVGAGGGRHLFGTPDVDAIHGTDFNDQIDGLASDDILSGGGGADILNGGAGTDTADYATAAGAVTARLDIEAASNDGDGGTDTFSGIENLTGSSFDDILVGDAAANTLFGRAGNDSLSGGGGDDILRGGAGVDVMAGGLGIDTVDYSLAAAGMRAQLNTNASTNDGDGGTDTFSGIENLTGSAFNDILIGDGNTNILRGGTGADTLLGLAGNDALWGGAGALNTLQGGLGDDTYVLEAADSIVENAAEGTDTVDARINTYILANNVENLLFGGTGNFNGTGNALGNVITGGAGNDALRGRGGIDMLHGGLGSDTADYTLAAAGVVARLDTQQAVDDGDGATDVYTGVENLIGSNFNDVLIGDGNANVLMGGIGTDTLLGFGGDDILMGGSGGGNNQLQGGEGNDWYILDAFDTCFEFADEGVDTVEARVASYTLGSDLENLLYTGPGGFTGNGNALDNIITGGNQNDVLRGRGGDDTINGGLGADEVQFTGTKAQYTVTVEGDGYRIIDTIAARDGSTFVTSIEKLRFLTGNTTTNLTYPPVAPGALEPTNKAVGEDVDGPLVSPLVGGRVVPSMADDAFVLDLPMVIPPAFDDGLKWLGVTDRVALWRLAIAGENSPLTVDGLHGAQLPDRVSDFDVFPGFDSWG